MNKRLVPCPSCKRHLFVDERSCPHCQASESKIGGVMMVAMAVGLTACSGGEVAAVYGPAPVDTSTRVPDATATVSAQPPPRVDVEVYGPAPVDTSKRTPMPSSIPTVPPSASIQPPVTPPPAFTPPMPAPVYGPPPIRPPGRLPVEPDPMKK